MSKYPTIDVKPEIKSIYGITESLLDDLCERIDDLEKLEKQGLLGFGSVDEATKRLSQLEGTTTEKLAMGVQDRIREEFSEGRRELKRLEGVAQSDERLKAFTKLRKRVLECIKIAGGTIHGFQKPSSVSGDIAGTTQELTKSH